MGMGIRAHGFWGGTVAHDTHTHTRSTGCTAKQQTESIANPSSRDFI